MKPLTRTGTFALISFFACVQNASSLAQNADTSAPLKPYTSCNFPDDLRIVGLTPLAAEVKSRSVQTADGEKQIDLLSGTRIMFAYPFTDFYANVKVEQLPEKSWPALRKDLLANLTYTQTHTPGTTVNASLPADLHHFEVFGEDRSKLEGGVIGLYLLFDEKAHVVTSIYFLNQDPMQRKFQTIEEYRHLRDQFLTSYTGCVRENQAIRR